MDTWHPNSPEPPQDSIERAKREIPKLLSEIEVNSDGKHEVELAILVSQIRNEGHISAAAEWAIYYCLKSSLLVQSTIEKLVSLPGPQKHTFQAKTTKQSHVGVQATDELWEYWRIPQQSKNSLNSEGPGRMPSKVHDVGIVITLKEEFRVFHKGIEDKCVSHTDPDDNSVYYTFDHSTPNGDYKCVATLAMQMGESRAARVTERLIHNYQPAVIVVLGIAGGISDDLRLGDVVVATFVESYIENSKAVDSKGISDSFELRLGGEPYRTSNSLASKIEHVEFSNGEIFREWVSKCAAFLASKVSTLNHFLDEDFVRESPQLHCGPIASGPIVGASERFLTFLKTKNRKFLAIEMESGGVLASIEEQTSQLHSLVIRGISDFGDHRKKELDAVDKGAFREVAMHNAIQALWSAMEAQFLPRSDQPHTQAAVTTPDSSHSQSETSDLDLRGCSSTSISLRVDSVGSAIKCLTDHFNLEWEPASFEETPPVVYWPVRLRPPTPIHAVQAFTAALLQRQGGKVILCLDDLGTREHTPEAFFATLRRWCKRIGDDIRFDERKFSEMIGGTDPLNAWPFVEKWLGHSEKKMLDVLKISKIVKPEDSDESTLKILEGRRPRRLLTPAMVWTCLAQILKEYPQRGIITLGGADERQLWSAWRESIMEGNSTVGHLYIPNLGKEPVHMASANLGWESHSDILESLKADVQRPMSSSDWKDHNRLVAWSLNGCVSLPGFLSSGSSHITKFEIQDNANPDSLIEDLSRALNDRLLRHS